MAKLRSNKEVVTRVKRGCICSDSHLCTYYFQHVFLSDMTTPESFAIELFASNRTQGFSPYYFNKSSNKNASSSLTVLHENTIKEFEPYEIGTSQYYVCYLLIYLTTLRNPNSGKRPQLNSRNHTSSAASPRPWLGSCSQVTLEMCKKRQAGAIA